MSHELFWADGELHDSEEEIFKFMIKSILTGDQSKVKLEEEMASWDTADGERKALKELIEGVGATIETD